MIHTPIKGWACVRLGALGTQQALEVSDVLGFAFDCFHLLLTHSSRCRPENNSLKEGSAPSLLESRIKIMSWDLFAWCCGLGLLRAFEGWNGALRTAFSLTAGHFNSRNTAFSFDDTEHVFLTHNPTLSFSLAPRGSLSLPSDDGRFGSCARSGATRHIQTI